MVIPTHRVGPHLHECLAHLAAQTYRNFDAIVVTEEPFTAGVPGLELHALTAGPVQPNVKRLRGAESTDADIIALIDDDAYPAPDWLARAAAHFRDDDVVAVGGPGLTPPADTRAQRGSGAVYASPLASGAAARRYVARAARSDVDLLPTCNLLVRRHALIAAMQPTLPYYGGEDALLCALLRRDGRRIVYDPGAIVYHHRRPLFRAHLRQVWLYAVQRGRLVRRHPALARDLTYFVPLGFAMAHIVVLAALLRRRRIGRVPRLLALAYASLLAVEALRARRRHDVGAPAIALGIYLTHLAYGAGLAYGFVRYAGER